MSTLLEPDSIPPALRRELIIRALDAGGQFVVKDTSHSAYFQVGEQEHFLFTQLDGRRSSLEIRTAFERRFQEPLTEVDLDEFLALATRRGLLERDVVEETQREAAPRTTPPRARKQTLLYYRYPFFDPDRLLNVLEPRLRWIWTRGFLGFALLLMAVAAGVAWTNREQWISTFPHAITWQTLLLVWTLIFVATMLHEFAHGLTCKHFGGEVHEIGFLLLFFMPCLYCNVSDAWLFRQRWKRLWVGVAGTFCDLLVWALATLAWRVTLPETAHNYLAWMLSTVCGGRCLFNFNPLLKLDGYYLLSDWVGVPNLSDRGRSRWFKTVRWLLWGGPRPARDPRGRLLLCYGLGSWVFIGLLLGMSLFALLRLQDRGLPVGYLGGGLSLLMVLVIGKNMFRGIFVQEFTTMLTKRRLRTLFWAILLIGGPLVCLSLPFHERAAGTFLVRPSTRVEINALEAGFLRDISLEEGSRVSAGTQIARIDIPDLAVNISKKQAEIRESEANLRKLEAGPRPEEVAAQRQRVERALAWRDLGKQDLVRAGQAFVEEVFRLDRQIAQFEAEREQRRLALLNAEKLSQQKALSGEQLQSEKTRLEVKSLELEQARAAKRAREANGTLVAESEAARREIEWANERSALELLEAGGRLEEIEAERARLARLHEERKYLEGLQSRVLLCSPAAGVITTPRMLEKNGQHVVQGAPVCVVEELSDVVAEIAIKEDDELGVQPGQLVHLRARAIPSRIFEARVDRKAPTAVVPLGQSQGTVTVYCRLAEHDAEILSGMTGHARIYRAHRPLGLVLRDKVLKHVRTEFWWW